MNIIKTVFAGDGVIENPLINPSLGSGGTEAGTRIIGDLISNIINAMMVVAAIILLIMIIWAGIAWASAGDNKERMQGAQKRLSNAIIGFIIVICVFAIANFIGGIFGIGWLKDFNIPLPTPSGT